MHICLCCVRFSYFREERLPNDIFCVRWDVKPLESLIYWRYIGWIIIIIIFLTLGIYVPEGVLKIGNTK